MKAMLFSIIIILILFIKNGYSQNDTISPDTYFEFKNGTIVESYVYVLPKFHFETYDSVKLVGENNVLIKEYESEYRLMFYGNNGQSTLKYIGYKDGISQEILSKRIHFNPSPFEAYLGGFNGGAYNMSRVYKKSLKDAHLYAAWLNIEDIRCKVKSFQIILYNNKGKIRKNMQGEDGINEEIYSEIKKLPSGSSLYFCNIQIEYNGVTIYVDPIVVFLK
jgi:hypothetical protein